jgi:hypothetical protein
VLVVLINERNHHLLKLIYINIPTLLLYNVVRILNVKFEIVDTFDGENYQFIYEDERNDDVYVKLFNASSLRMLLLSNI